MSSVGKVERFKGNAGREDGRGENGIGWMDGWMDEIYMKKREGTE